MTTWIDVDGLCNLRDVGGLAGPRGAIRPGLLLRSDNLQDLPAATVERLLGLGITDVVDLRSQIEINVGGPGPLRDNPALAFHEHSFFADDGAAEAVQGQDLPGEALPYTGAEYAVDLVDRTASSYAQMLSDRTDSAVAALRVIAAAQGATLVHCAAGKDRTGIVVALAALLCGVERDQVVADYAATTERIGCIVRRLQASPAYAENMAGQDPAAHAARPESMVSFLTWLDDEGGPAGFLGRAGWTAADTRALQAKLIG